MSAPFLTDDEEYAAVDAVSEAFGDAISAIYLGQCGARQEVVFYVGLLRGREAAWPAAHARAVAAVLELLPGRRVEVLRQEEA